MKPSTCLMPSEAIEGLLHKFFPLILISLISILISLKFLRQNLNVVWTPIPILMDITLHEDISKAYFINLPKLKNWTPWPESASEQYRPSDRGLSAKLVPTSADTGCHVVSVTDPYGRILGFLDRSHYFFFQVDSQFYSRGWVDPVPEPLFLRKSGSAGNRTRTSGSVARNSDY
jgi:hypothetical protein